MDGVARKLEIRRHRDQARAHDAVIGGEKFGAVGRQDRDAVAAFQPVLDQRPRHAVRHIVDLRKRELARRRLAAEVDDGNLRQIAAARDQIAEIREAGHTVVQTRHGLFGAAVRYVPRPLAMSLPSRSTISASAVANWEPKRTTLPRVIKSPGMATR